MSAETRELLKQNIGKACYLYFKGIPDDNYRSGVIKKVTESNVELFFIRKNYYGEPHVSFTTHIDIDSIRLVQFQEPNIFMDGDYVTDRDKNRE